MVSIGRLITLAKAGSSLEEDLTWSTITYIEWVQCEGPVSVISVCLPKIFGLGKRIHSHGIRSVLKSGSVPDETAHSLGSVNRKSKFVRMDTSEGDSRGDFKGEAEVGGKRDRESGEVV